MLEHQSQPSSLEELIADGERKGLFQIKGEQVHYVAQDFTDDFSDPEEKVRVGLFYDLVLKYGYKNTKEIIDLEFNRIIGHPHKKNASRLDVIIYRPDHTPFAIFELKSDAEYERYFEDSIKTQLFERAANEDKGSGKLQYLVYYTRYYEDGELNEKIVTIDYTRFKTFEQWVESGRQNLRTIPAKYGKVDKPPQFIKGSTDREHRLRDNVRREELDRIAEDLNDVLWGGGRHQNELFYNLIGLFLTKIYDEKIKEPGSAYDFQVLFDGDEPETPEATYARINRLFRGVWEESAKRYSQCALSYLLGLSDEQLKKTPDIVFSANKVRYVVETLQSISFTSNKYDVLGDFFEKIVRLDLKQTKGQYLTPHNLVDFIVEALRLEDLTIDLINGRDGRPRLPYVIDPSCGSGTFQVQCMKRITQCVVREQQNPQRLKQTDDVLDFIELNFPPRKRNGWAKEYIYGIEIYPDLAMATKVNMVGHGDGSANIHAADGLVDFTKYEDGKLLNIRTKNTVYDKWVNEQFDVVVSNPPFSIVVDKETAKQFPDLYIQGKQIAKALKNEAKKEVDTENLFLERWYQLLKPGGRMGVVLPDSVFDTSNNRDIRLFIFKYFWVKAVVSLPSLAFAPYTMTKTSLLFAQKKTESEVKEWNARWAAAVEEFFVLRKELERLKKRKDSSVEFKQEFLKSLKSYLRSLFDTADDGLSVSELLAKYDDDIKQVNEDWWAFGKLSEVFDYPIFMAHAEEVGYKRGENKEEVRPNELFTAIETEDSRTIVIDTENPRTILDHLVRNVVWR